ncbi:N-acetyltransferase [Vibrio mangrovi]|uniref:N-acetyltransferase n=1 Tax=Vibrio mangrovi TaxID=474394 RepID=A0A1Y6J0D6_9VIBR|nr:N-acetyltransferase [Vibrio mangrovi]MDW6002390.1 N-acetyltransferase [Vibrio mangrovi]SMS02711.1 putative N-acetyltransferase YjaB [Vibrio mangrovi]
MIRAYRATDIDRILEIWFAASLQAHHFIAPEFWQSQLENMRHLYLPAAETYLYEQDSEIVGFCSLYENNLAAIFVIPEKQGQGIGKQLLTHARSCRESLTLTVYQANEASYQFYLSQGFKVIGEQVDEHTGCPEYLMYG